MTTRLADWMGCSLDFHRASGPGPGWLLAQPPRRGPEPALHPPLMLSMPWAHATRATPLCSCSPLQPPCVPALPCNPPVFLLSPAGH